MQLTTLKRAKRGLTERRRTTKPLITFILTATDFSPESLAGVRYASVLAQKFRSKIRLVHIVEPTSSLRGTCAALLARTDQEVASLARARLEKLGKAEMPRVSRLCPCVNIGKPFDKIVEIARLGKADLIVIGTHGHTGIRRVVMGSTAENVVRYAHCPVLTVPSWCADRTFRLSTILVPIDFSNLSKDALPYATLMAGAFRAEIVLMNVVEKFPIDYLLGREQTGETLAPMRRCAEAELRKIADTVSEATGLRVRTVISEGKPFEQICKAGKQHAADMIILTTHGYTGVKRMWLGSTAEHVIRRAECPVLVVGERERKRLA